MRFLDGPMPNKPQYSKSSEVTFRDAFTLMLLSLFIAPVYALYSFGYWMHHSGWPRWIVLPYAWAFAVINVIHNATVCTVLFRELPREWFTTQRLKRWKNSPEASRREMADLLGGFLERQDEGHYL
jgi:hypothetical protein